MIVAATEPVERVSRRVTAFGELLDIQFEMMALAFQTGQTRISSMRMIREASMRTFPSVNVDEAFHPLSHHGEDPAKHEKLVKVQAYQTERFTKFIKRLSEIKEGNGNILDNSIILFGSILAWAVIDRISLKRRSDPGAPPIPVGGMRNDIIAVFGGVALYALAGFWFHPYVIGVPVFGA